MSNVELNQGSPGSRPVDRPTIGQGAGEHAIVAAKKATDARRLTRGQLFRRRFMRNRGAVLGLVGFIFIVVFAIMGPYVANYDYTESDFLAFNSPPNADHWLGTTKDGSDVFAMIVEGLRKSLVVFGVGVFFWLFFEVSKLNKNTAYDTKIKKSR